MPTPQVSIFAYRQALSAYLRDLVAYDVLPSYNAAVTMYLTSTDSTKIPTMTAVNVVAGNLTAIKEPTICVYKGQRSSTVSAATQEFLQILTTTMTLKLPYCGNGRPEDFELVESLFEDQMNDYFNSLGRNRLFPIDRVSGLPTIPGAFVECSATGFYSYNTPTTTAAGTLYVRAVDVKHSAEIWFPAGHSPVVGPG